MRTCAAFTAALLLACSSPDADAGGEIEEAGAPEPSAEPEGPAPPSLAPLPASIDLDPCALLSEADLASMGLDPATVRRSGGLEQVPDGDGRRPYVRCSWQARGGPPLLWVFVQDGASTVEIPADAERHDVGESAYWGQSLSRGRDELRVVEGDRLVRIVSQALDLPGLSAERNVAVARMLLPRLDDPLEASPVDFDPSRWGGPAVDMCSVVSDEDVGRLLDRGDVIWKLPTVSLNVTPQSSSPRPDADGVGCRWVTTRNPAFSITWLGPDGVRDAERRYVDAEEVTVAGRPARYIHRGHKTLLVTMDDGALELAGQNLIRNRDDEQRALIEDLAAQAVGAM